MNIRKTIPPAAATAKVGGGVSVLAILAGLISYVAADHDRTSENCHKVRMLEQRTEESKEVIEQTRQDVGAIKVSLGMMQGDIEHTKEAVDDIKAIVQR